MTNKEPHESFRDDIEWKRIIHEVRMKERNENEIPFSRELFNSTFEELKSKSGCKYKFWKGVKVRSRGSINPECLPALCNEAYRRGGGQSLCANVKP